MRGTPSFVALCGRDEKASSVRVLGDWGGLGVGRAGMPGGYLRVAFSAFIVMVWKRLAIQSSG